MKHTLTTLALTTLLAAGAGAADAPTRRALLIGINDYAQPGITDLRGATGDVQMMSRVLETRLGFPRENITVLTDAQATRAGILAAIDRLVAQAGKDDVVYFHYSGHGSQVPDRNGDEPDGMDETIVAQDSRSPGVPDITDDEFDRRFDKLRTPNALLVFDSCHSGTVTRAVSLARPRAIPPDNRPELYTAATTRAAVAVGGLPHVLMTGAPSDQEALDGPVGEGFYGLFSWSLAHSLNENGPDATPEVIHEGVKQELRRIQETLYMRPPEPQLEAPAERMKAPLFGTRAAPEAGRRAWADVQPLDAGRVRLVGGAALGAQPGAQWAVYGPGETRFAYGAGLALGAVESVAGADATLRLTVAQGPVPAGARAIAVTPGAGTPVGITGAGEARAAALAAAISAIVPIQPARAGEPYRFLLELAGGAWHVRDAGGLRELATVPDGPDATVAPALAGALRPAARAADLLALDNLASDLKLWVGVQTAASAVPGTRSIVLVADDPAPAYRVRRPGEPRSNANSLVVEVQADREAWITIVDVDPEGTVNQLFPNPAQRPGFLPDGRIPANQVVRVPDSLAPGNQAGFYWDYSPPVGTDTVRVFAAADAATAQEIRRYVAQAAAGNRGLAGLGATLAAGTVRGIRVSTEEAPAPAPTPAPVAPATAATGEGASPGPTPGPGPQAVPVPVPAPVPAAGPPATGEWSAASLVIQIGE